MKLKKTKIMDLIIKLKINQILIKVSRIKISNQNIEAQNLKYHQILKWRARLKISKSTNSQKI